MKITGNKNDLLDEGNAWEAVMSADSTINGPGGYKNVHDYFIALNFLNELESGGHVSLVTWSSDIIEELGIHTYIERLTGMLEKVGAPEYAEIERQYAEKIWVLNKALEDGKDVMEEYDRLIEEADKKYWQLGDRLLERMKAYAVVICKELIEVVEE
jgi:hypothetical protein